MKISYECGACFLRQAREAMDLATDDDELKIDINTEIFKFLAKTFKKGNNSNNTGILNLKKSIISALRDEGRNVNIDLSDIEYSKSKTA